MCIGKFFLNAFCTFDSLYFYNILLFLLFLLFLAFLSLG